MVHWPTLVQWAMDGGFSTLYLSISSDYMGRPKSTY